MVHARILQVTAVLLTAVVLSIVCGCGGSAEISNDRPASDVNKDSAELTISASAGENGSITPSGDVRVEKHGAIDFLIVPAPGYEIDSVHVDNSYQGGVINYSFTNVTKPHTIRASFVSKKE
jgi:hypothetical protein